MVNKISEIIESLHNLENLMEPYEEKYNIKSQDFYELAQAGKLDENADFVSGHCQIGYGREASSSKSPHPWKRLSNK